MASTETIRPEQMGFMRRTADRMVTAGNVVDGAMIMIGLIAQVATVVALGIVGLIAGMHLKDEIRKGK